MSGHDFPLAAKRVWVAGHAGLVGSAVVRRLRAEACEVLTVGRDRLDLRRQTDVEAWLAAERPQVVVLAAATVGGIGANMAAPATFIYDNLMIEANVIDGAFRSGVEKLLLLGSSCVYPKLAPQPIPETALMTGPLEPTNEPYAVAKIAGISLCRAYRRQHRCDFICAMPTNLYGPLDNFDAEKGHVIPSLMARMHEAKLAGAPEVRVWGTGEPRREFLFVDDLADALVVLLRRYSDVEHVNVGTGEDVTIHDLVVMLKDIVGYPGRIEYADDRPDGTPRKLLDVSRLSAIGWKATTPLRTGLATTYEWYRTHFEVARRR